MKKSICHLLIHILATKSSSDLYDLKILLKSVSTIKYRIKLQTKRTKQDYHFQTFTCSHSRWMPQQHFYLSSFQVLTSLFHTFHGDPKRIRMAFSTPELQDPKTPEKPPVATPWVPSNMAWKVDCNAPRFQGDRGKHHLILPSLRAFQWDDQPQVGCINQSLCSEWCVLQPGSSGMLWSLA